MNAIPGNSFADCVLWKVQGWQIVAKLIGFSDLIEVLILCLYLLRQLEHFLLHKNRHTFFAYVWIVCRSLFKLSYDIFVWCALEHFLRTKKMACVYI